MQLYITSGGNNWTPFKKRRTEINETFIDETEHTNIAIPMCSLIEYNDNHSDICGSYDTERNSLRKIMEILLILAQIIHYILNINLTLLVPYQMMEGKIE